MLVSAGPVGAVGNRVRVGRPGCTGSIHSDFTRSLCTVFAKLLLLNVCHKNNFGPGLTFYRLRLSRLPLVGLSWMQGVAPWRRKEIQGGLHLGIFAHLPTLSPTSSSKNTIPLTTTMHLLLAFMVGSYMAMLVIKIPYT